MSGEKQTVTPSEQLSDTKEKGLRARLRAWKVGRAAAKVQARENAERYLEDLHQRHEAERTRLQAEAAALHERANRPMTAEGVKAFNRIVGAHTRIEGGRLVSDIDPYADPTTMEALRATWTGASSDILKDHELGERIAAQVTDGIIDEGELGERAEAASKINEAPGVAQRVVELAQPPQETAARADEAALGDELVTLKEQIDTLTTEAERTADPELTRQAEALQRRYDDTLEQRVHAQDEAWKPPRR